MNNYFQTPTRVRLQRMETTGRETGRLLHSDTDPLLKVSGPVLVLEKIKYKRTGDSCCPLFESFSEGSGTTKPRYRPPVKVTRLVSGYKGNQEFPKLIYNYITSSKIKSSLILRYPPSLRISIRGKQQRPLVVVIAVLRYAPCKVPELAMTREI